MSAASLLAGGVAYVRAKSVGTRAPTVRAPRHLGRHRASWTAKEESQLRIDWGVKSVQAIAKALGRTPEAVYQRAVDSGLGAGCPQGFEYIQTAAVRTGFTHRDLKRILVWANVKIRTAMAHPAFPNRRRIVEPSCVDEAIACFLRAETMRAASRRTGYSPPTLRTWVEAAAAAGEIEIPARARGKFYRLPPEVVDAVVAKQMARVRWPELAAKYGINACTLKKWMREAGHGPPRGTYWHFPDGDAVARVVASKRAAGNKAFRTKHEAKGD